MRSGKLGHNCYNVTTEPVFCCHRGSPWHKLTVYQREALPRRSLCWLARESKPSWFNNKILVHFCKSRTIQQHVAAYSLVQCMHVVCAWCIFVSIYTRCLNSLECNVIMGIVTAWMLQGLALSLYTSWFCMSKLWSSDYICVFVLRSQPFDSR